MTLLLIILVLVVLLGGGGYWGYGRYGHWGLGGAVGLVLIIVFALTLHLVPTSGWGKPANYVLPVLTLGLNQAALLTRITRASVLGVPLKLGQEVVCVESRIRMGMPVIFPLLSYAEAGVDVRPAGQLPTG
jgi:hypothetical protein